MPGKPGESPLNPPSACTSCISFLFIRPSIHIRPISHRSSSPSTVRRAQKLTIILLLNSTFTSTLTSARKANVNGVYDVHTNTIQYPAVMQPTRVRAVQIVDPDQQDADSAMFPPLPAKVARNFFITDIRLETPPTGVAPASYDRPFRSAAAAPSGFDRADFLAPFRGLEAVPVELKNLLPPECCEAFDKALGNERAWHAKWGDEEESMCRRAPIIDKRVVPYSMPLQ